MNRLSCLYKDSPSLTYNLRSFERALDALKAKFPGQSIRIDDVTVCYTVPNKVLVYLMYCGQIEYVRKEIVNEHTVNS